MTEHLAEDNEYEAFERELQAILALDPTERIDRYSQLADDLEAGLDNT